MLVCGRLRKTKTPNDSSKISVDIDKLILKLTWKGKGSRIVRTICRNKNTVGEIAPPEGNASSAATVSEVAWKGDRHTV